MSKLNAWRPLLITLILVGIAVLVPMAAAAGTITVKTVPWVATNPLIPHDTWSGATTTLKGTADQQGNNVTYTWDFGDGSAVATGTVGNKYVIEAPHVYNGATGTIYTARLTVTNQTTGDTGTQTYFVAIRDKTLQIEVNVAIDNGLWYLHKNLNRYNDSFGNPIGDWSYLDSGYYGMHASCVQAFEVNGHLELGDTSNPYVEDVQRGMKQLFYMLTTGAIPGYSTSGTGYAVGVNQSYQIYQGGMFMDALVASGTPNATAPTGQNASGLNPGIINRTYKSIVWDMVDFYYFCQYRNAPQYGGWRYNCGDAPDNSASQWAAIGILAADRKWSIPIPAPLISLNINWLAYSQDPSAGWFGYTNSGYYPWGPYSVTASGMVQLVMDGIGRGDPRWDKAETDFRNYFTGPYAQPINTYYYAAFAFTKAMLLHQPPIVMLHSQTPGVPDLDWYNAQVSKGDPADGVARFLVNGQQSPGYWCCHSPNTSLQIPFETPWALIMLNRTIITAGQPVAVAMATPNPALTNQTITLDGSQSYQQDLSKKIVKWEWDINNNGTYPLSGPKVTTSYPNLGTYPVTLRVTDNSTPPLTATTTIQVLVTIPPTPPTANAGGPYTFCPGKKWFLDGTKSVEPDAGQHEPGAPPDYITQYAWDLFGGGTFADAFGATPDVTGKWPTGSYLIQLKVTDNNALSFPQSNLGNLSGTASSQVVVKASCTCISDLTALAKTKLVQITWTNTMADHYNVYRGTTQGGPYTQITTIPGSSLSRLGFLDKTVTNGVTYYYVVRDANLAGDEYCQSNEVKAKPVSLF